MIFLVRKAIIQITISTHEIVISFVWMPLDDTKLVEDNGAVISL